MLKLKKQNLNIVLGLLLIGLMYHTPTFLHNMATNVLGRAVIIIILLYLAVACDFSCAVIFSLIVIVLFQNTIEGFPEKKKEKKKAQEKKGEEIGPETGDLEEGNENKDDEDGAQDKGEETLNKGSDAATDALGVSLKRPIDSLIGFFSATVKNAKGLTKLASGTTDKLSSTENMETTEGFLGMNLVNDIQKHAKNFGNNLRNITDLDRRLKTSAESNTIASTKDFN